jgi:hypothetical protein
MSKKSWLGGSKDDEQSADANKDNPSSAGSQDPNLARTADSGVEARPTNILQDVRNPETDQGEVNPHNEAAAQRPGFVPLDPEVDRERLRNPKSDKDRADAIRHWMRDVRTRGTPMSADWEELEVLLGQRQRPPSPEDIAKAEREAKERGYGPAAETNATSNQRPAPSDGSK